MTDDKLAVLIDADNVSYTHVKEMMEEISKNGTPTIKRIYADWTKPTVSGWKNILLENAITPVQQYSYTMTKKFSTAILINAEPSKVWTTLTEPELISDWMGEPEMKLEVETSWKINSPIFIRGFHHIKFENRGIVLKYIDNEILSYSHLSSVSRLPDKIENYSVLEFVLTPANKQTTLALNISNFPTETIQKHLEFYWRGTIHKIKEYIETQG